MIAIIKREYVKSNIIVIDDIDLDNYFIIVDDPLDIISKEITSKQKNNDTIITINVKEIEEDIVDSIEEVDVIIPANKEPKELSIDDIKNQIAARLSNFNK